MTMSRTPLSLVVLLLLGQLTACAQPALPAAPVPGQPPAEALPTAGILAPAPAASAPPAAASADDTRSSAEPIIIRGNDRMVAPPRIAANAPARGSTSLKFEGAPAAEVVKVMLSDLLKVDYVIHPPLAGSITLTTRDAVSADRALLLLETALQVNGIVMARDSRGTYHVGTPEALRGVVSAPALAAGGQPLPPGYGAVIIPLQYLGAGEMANILRPMVSADAIVRVDSLRNILVMRGTRAEAEGWLDLVATFDVNLLRGMSVGVFPLKHTSAAEVDAALRLLSSGTAAAAAAAPGGAAPAPAGRAAAAPRPGAQAATAAPAAPAALGEGSPLHGALRVLPIERINAVMVVTPRAAYLDEVRYWIEQFDRPNLNSAEPQLFVYKVQNGSSTHLAELLNGIYGGSTAQQPGATGIAPGLTGTSGTSPNVNSSFAGQYSSSRNNPFGGGIGGNRFGGLGSNSFGSGTGLGGGLGGMSGLGGLGGAQGQQAQQGPNVVTTTLGQNVRVMADRINNTLLIHATAAEYERIEATLKRLDVQRAQVLIEASIVEVTLGDGLQYGLQWAFRGGIGDGSGRGVIGASAVGGGLAATGASDGGFTYTFRNAAGISAVLTALANKSLLKVISSPSLMVMDNHTAAIQVGNQEPVNTGTVVYTNSNVSSTSIQYKDTGVMLGVTPSVSAGDLVTLDVDQIVTTLGPDSSSAQTRGYPTFLQRQINSKVAVRSGETLVLGGLIQDSVNNTRSGVPLLSDIPVVGALFGTRDNRASRTELLVVLTPRVVRADDDVRAISRELRDRMQGLVEPAAVPGQRLLP